MRPLYLVFRILLISGILLSVACERKSDQEAVQALIEQTVEERLTKYRKIRYNKCREQVLEEANRLADSILIAQARLARDTMSKPQKPDRPDRPEIKQLLDTTPIAPFLEFLRQDSLRQDSILRDSIRQDSILQDSILRELKNQ